MKIYYKEKLLEINKENEKIIIFNPNWISHKNLNNLTYVTRNKHWEKITHYIDNNYKADPFGGRIQYEDESILLIVNAWDEGSFIGNKGSIDHSLDGWTVAGGHYLFKSGIWGKPLGTYSSNLSYFHNVFYQKQLLNDILWYYGP